jgi:UDP-N-acetyl-D-galactosamine dehydrogenase
MNSQRINIAFVNELAKIFKLMNIDTNQVLEAAQQNGIFYRLSRA